MLLQATQVAIERGDRRLLSDVDLSVSGGEIWQLVGANGCLLYTSDAADE